MDEHDGSASSDDRVARLERRLDRERRARLEAERIAEEGMRSLWFSNQELERRVAERTVELERSLRAAEMATEAKESFLDELGHRLATPLHAIVGLAELIDDEGLSTGQRERLEALHAHVVALGELVHGLTDLAGAQGGSAPGAMSPRSAADWLDEVVADWQRTLLGSGKLLVVDDRCPNTPMIADWARLRVMCNAALDNVVRFAEAGRVRFELWHEPAPTAGTVVAFAVTDVGPGLGPDEIAAARQPFVRLRPGGRLGVGLAIVERLALSGGGWMAMSSGGSPGDEPAGVRLAAALPATLA